MEKMWTIKNEFQPTPQRSQSPTPSYIRSIPVNVSTRTRTGENEQHIVWDGEQ